MREDIHADVVLSIATDVYGILVLTIPTLAIVLALLV